MSTKPYSKYPLPEPRPAGMFEKYLYRDLETTVRWIKKYTSERGEVCPYCGWHHGSANEDCKEYPPGKGPT